LRASPGYDGRMDIRITIGPERLVARLEQDAAPVSCAAFLAMLPLERHLIHGRWSGESGWAPLGEVGLDLPDENGLHRPVPGQILLYAGDLSEPEILVPYGQAAFGCKDGPLSGNHILTVTRGADALPRIGHALLWNGAQTIRFEVA
jgi:hypothetical protein